MVEEEKEVGVENKPEIPKQAFKQTLTMSDSVGALAGAMSKAQGEMTNGTKGKQGYGYKYMELGSLIEIARPCLANNEIAVIQTHDLDRSGKAAVVTHTVVMHSSGEWLKSSLTIPITEMKQLSPAQMMGVSMTYGRRYALQSLFLIASEDDTDASKK